MMSETAKKTRDELLGHAADEYFAAVARGEAPAIDDFANRYPEIADDVRRVFPALALVGDSISDGSAHELVSDLGGRHQLGDFRIVRELGRGGMGVVYEAAQMSIGRRVALKVLPFAAMLDKQQLNRFKNEARAAGTLEHPNIVSVHAVGSERGVYYYAMQLIEGPSLADIITDLRHEQGMVGIEASQAGNTVSRSFADNSSESDMEGATSVEATSGHDETKPEIQAALSTLPDVDTKEYWRNVAILGVQAAEALDHAHQNGIVHRDVKPGNLLIDAFGKLYVTDFGLARIEADAGITMSGDLLGTIRYMSPEQALANQAIIDHRTDIYSLGATLYELITLQPVYQGQNRQELLRRLAQEEPKRLRKCVPHAPADLETIVHKSLGKDPADRYDTAGALANDLQAFIENRSIVARPDTRWMQVQRWARHHASLVTAGFAIGLIALVVLAVGGMMIRHERDFARESAKKANQNLDLALEALDETLSDSLIGELAQDTFFDDRQMELLLRGIHFYEEFAKRNDLDLANISTYQRLVCAYHTEDAFRLRDAGKLDEARHSLDFALGAIDGLAKRKQEAANVSPQELGNVLRTQRICLNNYANFASSDGDRQLALTLYQRERKLIDNPALGLGPKEITRELATNAYNVASVVEALGDTSAAEKSYKRALILLTESTDPPPHDEDLHKLLAGCYYNLGLLQGMRGRRQEATANWEASLVEWRGLAAEYPSVSEYHSRAGATINNLAVLMWKGGEPDGARVMLEEALVYQKRALALQPVYHNASTFLANHFKTLEAVLTDVSDFAAVERLQNQRSLLFLDQASTPIDTKVDAVEESASSISPESSND